MNWKATSEWMGRDGGERKRSASFYSPCTSANDTTVESADGGKSVVELTAKANEPARFFALPKANSSRANNN
jgi:hypothetical protein